MRRSLKNKHYNQSVRNRLFLKTPVWKLLLRITVPTVLANLSYAFYFFADTIFAIWFASDSYANHELVTSLGLTTAEATRYFMESATPIFGVTTACSLLFALGISSRVSANLGANKVEKAKQCLKTGYTWSMLITIFVVVPVLVLTSKMWMGIQFTDAIASLVVDEGFKYVLVILLVLPFIQFNQNCISTFRAESRNYQITIVSILPIVLNLTLDWVFMGALDYGIIGSAFATFVAQIFTTCLVVFFMYYQKSDVINLKNMFGVKTKVFYLIGIFLIGISPFLRNFSNAFLGSFEMNILNNVSDDVYYADFWSEWDTLTPKEQQDFIAQIPEFQTSDPATFEDVFGSDVNADNVVSNPENYANNEIQSYYAQIKSSTYMNTIFTMALPIYNLVFAIGISFIQGAWAVGSYNFGAKRYSRCKNIFCWNLVYSFLSGLILYFLFAFALAEPLVYLLNIEGDNQELINDTTKVLQIILLSHVFMSMFFAGASLFAYTNKIWLSVFANTLGGLIIIWPVAFGMQAFAVSVGPTYEWTIWWMLPVNALVTSLIVLVASVYTIKKIAKNPLSIDQKITRIYNKIKLSKSRNNQK